MRVLVIAPHGDDEILGVGGTIYKYSKLGYEVFVCNVTIGKTPLYSKEQTERTMRELLKARNLLNITETIYLDFPAITLDSIPKYKINNKLGEVITEIRPDIVYIPHYGDINNDHYLVAQASLVALRPRHDHFVKEIYSYETLSSTEWADPNVYNAFIPNVWVNIENEIEMKLNAMSLIKTQLHTFPNARSLKAIRSLSEYRGSTINKRNAESFRVIRLVKD